LLSNLSRHKSLPAMPTMVRFTDAQIQILRELATPLSPFQRGRFLQLVVERLSGVTIGDGAVHKAGYRSTARGNDRGRSRKLLVDPAPIASLLLLLQKE
jgi:hypothetical protein